VVRGNKDIFSPHYIKAISFDSLRKLSLLQLEAVAVKIIWFVSMNCCCEI